MIDRSHDLFENSLIDFFLFFLNVRRSLIREAKIDFKTVNRKKLGITRNTRGFSFNSYANSTSFSSYFTLTYLMIRLYRQISFWSIKEIEQWLSTNMWIAKWFFFSLFDQWFLVFFFYFNYKNICIIIQRSIVRIFLFLQRYKRVNFLNLFMISSYKLFNIVKKRLFGTISRNFLSISLSFLFYTKKFSFIIFQKTFVRYLRSHSNRNVFFFFFFINQYYRFLSIVLLSVFSTLSTSLYIRQLYNPC